MELLPRDILKDIIDELPLVDCLSLELTCTELRYKMVGLNRERVRKLCHKFKSIKQKLDLIIEIQNKIPIDEEIIKTLRSRNYKSQNFIMGQLVTTAPELKVGNSEFKQHKKYMLSCIRQDYEQKIYKLERKNLEANYGYKYSRKKLKRILINKDHY